MEARGDAAALGDTSSFLGRYRAGSALPTLQELSARTDELAADIRRHLDQAKGGE
ncbi:hypothetical protein ACH4U7_08705 [Streptomyces sp. NPDC020845]|uniref:hypothetical protein n=1 Tax=Streptomyces sp. NPDC020845 TaxID=3365096 RepID=UPI0037AE5BE3